MGEGSKRNFFGKVINVLSGKNLDQSDLSNNPQVISQDDVIEASDLVFARNFTASGGKFLYCEEEDEALDFLRSIVLENKIEEIHNTDINLSSILRKAGLGDLEASHSNATAFCCSCEYLIAFNGGIMISANQTKGVKLGELPEIFIIIAQTSQIVENLRTGLTGIRKKHSGNIPSQITTIKGPIKSDISEEPSGNSCNKEVYLLLIEDQA